MNLVGKFAQFALDSVGEINDERQQSRHGNSWRRTLAALPHTRVVEEAPRQSRLVRIQYAAIAAMKNDMRSAMPAMVAIMLE